MITNMPKLTLDKTLPKAIGIAAACVMYLASKYSSGIPGAASTTKGLKTMGFGMNMEAGLVTLGGTPLVISAIGEPTISRLAVNGVRKRILHGEDREAVIADIEKYPFSDELKARMRETARATSE
ncbi:hypothetical protein [Bifidobacterium leontopitheci]|uniref:Uncharacterized protein n=1 Tax=Bifidobacterium leontopitheci TaxID=2650774 RepID=A0A6I1GNP3_9BIFI|nr:hypothetical protein [Bifidobacterium leontopitheci]KAB7791156.1 hypothetical protein F7D09_0322 [Bifidobacterium leontopitheci]